VERARRLVRSGELTAAARREAAGRS